MSAARVMAAVPTSVSTPDPPTAVDAQRVTLFIQIKRRVIQVKRLSSHEKLELITNV